MLQISISSSTTNIRSSMMYKIDLLCCSLCVLLHWFWILYMAYVASLNQVDSRLGNVDRLIAYPFQKVGNTIDIHNIDQRLSCMRLIGEPIGQLASNFSFQLIDLIIHGNGFVGHFVATPCKGKNSF